MNFMKDKLSVKTFETRDEMGKAAAAYIAESIKKFLAEKDEINMIFAATPSQNDVLHHLCMNKEIKADGRYVAPWFIETHTHGAAGYDFLDNTKEEYIEIAKAHAKHGTTPLVPTITSSTTQGMIDSIEVFESIGETGRANLLGIQ